MWVARYLLFRLAEKYGLDVELYCKPIKGDWNGSGMHTNFSTKILREVGGKEYFEKLMGAFEKYRDEHIQAYGPDNHLRLTACMRHSRSTSSTGVLPIEVPRFACLIALSTATTRVTSKIVDPIRKPIHTRSYREFSRRSKRLASQPVWIDSNGSSNHVKGVMPCDKASPFFLVPGRIGWLMKLYRQWSLRFWRELDMRRSLPTLHILDSLLEQRLSRMMVRSMSVAI